MLVKEIEKHFTLSFDEFEKGLMEKFGAEEKEAIEKHKTGLAKIQREIENEKKRAYSSELAAERLNARKDYANKREGLIGSVFEMAEKRARDVLLDWNYIKAIKDFVDKTKVTEMTGGYEEYKGTFPLIGIDPKLNGIIVRKEGTLYDFTYSTFIESKRLELRHKIGGLLFGHDT
jgi:vacuolar-type H+-ATPase subunit E/Vma4